MPAAHSLDFRQQVVTFALTHSTEETAATFGICTQSVERYQKRAAAGNLAATKKGRYTKRKIDPVRLCALVEEHPDWEQAEFAAQFGVGKSAICKELKILGISRKKKLNATANATKLNAPDFSNVSRRKKLPTS
jgi:transposase